MNTDLDPMLPRAAVKQATGLSFPTIWREQGAGRFPAFESISPRRVGLKKSRLQEWLDGRRDWREPA